MSESVYKEVWEFDGGSLTFSCPDVTFLDTLKKGAKVFPERTKEDVYAIYYDVRLELGGTVLFDVRECESQWVLNIASIVKEQMDRSHADSFVREVPGSNERLYYGASEIADYLGYMYGWYMFKVERFITETLEDPESAYPYVYSDGFEFVKETYALTFGEPSDALSDVDTRVEAMKMYGIGGLRRDDMERLCEVAERFSANALKIGMDDEREYVRELENREG